jgi:hypothetical protein
MFRQWFEHGPSLIWQFFEFFGNLIAKTQNAPIWARWRSKPLRGSMQLLLAGGARSLRG